MLSPALPLLSPTRPPGTANPGQSITGSELSRYHCYHCYHSSLFRGTSTARCSIFFVLFHGFWSLTWSFFLGLFCFFTTWLCSFALFSYNQTMDVLVVPLDVVTLLQNFEMLNILVETQFIQFFKNPIWITWMSTFTCKFIFYFHFFLLLPSF